MTGKTATEFLGDAQESELSPARRYFILFAVMLSATLYSTTILLVATILPQLQGAMSATAEEISWTMTFNILATAVATPMAGWLAARLGMRRLMLWSVFGFTVATYFCGTSESLAELIFWRVLQGACGAPITPITQTILLNTFPKRQHGTAIGLFGVGVVLGACLGPVIGGLMVELISWRWAFFILPPVGIFAFFALSLSLPHDTPNADARLDWVGFLLLSLTIACAQLVLSRGQHLDWLESNEILLEIFLVAVGGYMFIVHSLSVKQPFINLRLLANRNYALGLILVFIYGMLNFTPMVILPSLLRDQVGYPDSLIGYVLGSRGFGAMIGFIIAMFVGQKYPRQSMLVGFATLLIAGAWLTTIDLNVTFVELVLNGIVQGLAVGIIWVPITIVSFSTLPVSVRPETSAVFHLLRNIGSSFFISLIVTEIVRSSATNYEYMTEMITPFSQSLALPGQSGGWNTDNVQSLARLSKEMARQAAMISYLNAFGLYTMVCAAAIPLVLLVARSPKEKA